MSDFLGDLDDWEEIGEIGARAAPARKGRRAAPGIPSSNSSEILESSEEPRSAGSGYLSPTRSSAGPVAPPRSRRTGGWADETIKSAKSKHAIQDPAELERFRSPEKKKEDSDDEIPMIPELDDLQDDDTTLQIAKAPSVVVNRVATYKELDSDLFKHAAFANLDDMNLRLLTKCLNSEADIKEVAVTSRETADSVWTWDLLFTDVASDLNAEWEGELNGEGLASKD